MTSECIYKLSPSEPDSPARDAPADLWAQRVREELPLQDHKRPVARLQGLPQEASLQLHVLHTTGNTVVVILWDNIKVVVYRLTMVVSD